MVIVCATVNDQFSSSSGLASDWPFLFSFSYLPVVVCVRMLTTSSCAAYVLFSELQLKVIFRRLMNVLDEDNNKKIDIICLLK